MVLHVTLCLQLLVKSCPPSFAVMLSILCMSLSCQCCMPLVGCFHGTQSRQSRCFIDNRCPKACCVKVMCDMTHSMCLSNQHIFLTCHNVERSSVQISFQCFLQTCKACVFLVSGKTLNTMQYHLHFGSYGHASCLWPDPESVHLFYVTSG